MTDAELLALYQARDERALTETDLAYGKLCRGLAARILGDRQDAEECVNDVLLKLWNAIPPAEPENMTAFVSAVTRNLCFDRLASAKRKKRGGGMLPAVLDELAPYLASEDDPEDCIDKIALQESIARFLGTLSKESRMIFLVRYWSFQPIAEIAKQHGATVGSVKMQLKRVKEKLRTHLEKEGLL
ncbi:MAG: sigma-70 family RNA polymerase sigma factor [Oscillospiraceae bacterium]|nr:sigma-70 family RNA polymerase sigma factor [Oscillospiraceae bacterium]